MKTTRFDSLEARLTLILLSALLLPTALIAWFAYGQLVDTIKTERIKTVGRVSDARHEQLTMRLQLATGRSQGFLADLPHRCGKLPAGKGCGLSQLQAFLNSEGALGAILRDPGGGQLSVGDPAVAAGEIPQFKPGQLAQFGGRAPGGERKYFIAVTDPDTRMQMAVTYSVQKIQSIFVSHPDLGNSGETFLADSKGFFITSARYPSVQGHSHPIAAMPMRRCLRPENAETLDVDYRDVAIIHGFRFVPEIGGGCIMAHIDQAEAFAPLKPLATQFLVAMLIFSGLAIVAARYFARRIAEPIRQMTGVTRTIAAGNLSARAISGGYDELAELASAFNAMTDQLVNARDTLEQRVSERTVSLRASETHSRESEQRFRQLFNCGSDAIFVVELRPDGRLGNFIEVNDIACERLGYAREEFLHMSPADIDAPEHGRADDPEFLRKLHENWQATIERVHVTRDGRHIPVEINVHLFTLAGKDAILGVARDVSERKQAEVEYRTIVETAHDGFWIVSVQDGRFLDVNPAACDMIGYSREEMLTLGIRDVDAVEQPEDTRRHIEAVIAGRAQRFDSRHRHKDGHLIDVEVSVKFIDVRGGAIVVFIRDVTARKQAEAALREAKGEAERARAEAERANAAKSRFLAAASHDLRQPLHALEIYVRLIAASVPPASAGIVDKMKQCSDNLSTLLNDLLDLSKLDAGAVQPRVAAFPLAKFLDQIAATHEPSAEKKDLLFRVAATRLVASTDAHLLRQLVANLVANAIHYTERGGILIGVRRRDGKLWIEVWDTGIGFPADKREEIFEPFRQLGNPARDRDHGAGLGLALVRSLAKVLGLQIRVASRLGRGSLFAVEVPRGTVAASVVAAVPRIAPQRRLRVALVEDQDFVREAMTQGLVHLGHEVVAAADVVELLARLDGVAPDLILADYRLKGGSTGSDAIAVVRKCYGAHIGAVVVTAETDPVVVKSIVDSGLRILHKPVQFDELATCLNEFETSGTAAAGTGAPDAATN